MTPVPMQAPVTPAAPRAPQAAPRVSFDVPGAGGAVQRYTTTDLAALRERKSELSNQLSSADGRRKAVQAALRNATGADKAGLEARLAVLDARIARLEQDIDENSSQLASLPAARVAATSGPHWGPDTGNRLADNAAPIGILFILFVLSPIAITFSRAVWRRGSVPAAAPASPETTHRLQRIEQAIESIAIEVERVSEGQRFVTRLMSDGRASALGSGQPAMEPVRVGNEQVVERR